MKTSETIDKVAEALSLAQFEFTPVVKNRINPYFQGHKYADLSSIFDATRPALSKHGLAFAQAPLVFEGRVTITTRILHKSGQWIESELSLKPTADTPQAIGSAITYGRRYSAQSILGVDAEDDDDGQSASQDYQSKRRAQEKLNALVVTLFDSKNMKHLEWLEEVLIERGVAAEKHSAIAGACHGMNRVAFDHFLAAKGQKPITGWVSE